MAILYSGVRSRGKGIEIDFMYQGIRCRETVPVNPTKSALKEQARKREVILYEIHQGKFDYSKHFPNSKKAKELSNRKGYFVTIKELLENYLHESRSQKALSTWNDHRKSVDNILIPQFGHLSVSDLKLFHIREWELELEVSAKRISNIISPLKSVIRHAIEMELIDKNPLDSWRPKSNKQVSLKEDINPFSLDDISSILNNLEGQARNYFQFAFFSGLRTNELIGLEWRDVNLSDETVYVQRAVVDGVAKSPKTKAGIRKLQLLPQALSALSMQKDYTFELGERVFHNPKLNKPFYSDQAVRESFWKPALKKAGIKYRKAYQTRHTYASMLLTAGVDPMIVAKLMGHEDWGMIRQHYGAWIKDVDNHVNTKIHHFLSQQGHKELLSV